jgi:DNA polymerase-3 subunit epsilon
MIAFAGDSSFALGGLALDRPFSAALARMAGMTVHPRVTKRVRLLVNSDPSSASHSQAKAMEYGIPIVGEGEFWSALGVGVSRADRRSGRS